MKKRTKELRSAALQNPYFLEFMRNHGQKAYDEIQLEILSDGLKNKRYFRNQQESFTKKCTQELHSNFTEIKKLALIKQTEISNGNAILLFALKHPILTAGIVGLAVGLIVAASIFTCGAAVGVGAAIGLTVGAVHIEAGVALGMGVCAGLFAGVVTFFSSKQIEKNLEKNPNTKDENKIISPK